MITKELLQSIKVIFRAPNLGLYGIPYDMRKDCGQQPMDIWRAHHEYEPPRPGWYGSKQVDISDWIWLGSPGWWGSMVMEEIELLTHFLKRLKDRGLIPQYLSEWTRLADFEDSEDNEDNDVEYDPMDRVGPDPEPESD